MESTKGRRQTLATQIQKAAIGHFRNKNEEFNRQSRKSIYLCPWGPFVGVWEIRGTHMGLKLSVRRGGGWTRLQKFHGATSMQYRDSNFLKMVSLVEHPDAKVQHLIVSKKWDAFLDSIPPEVLKWVRSRALAERLFDWKPPVPEQNPPENPVLATQGDLFRGSIEAALRPPLRRSRHWMGRGQHHNPFLLLQLAYYFGMERAEYLYLNHSYVARARSELLVPAPTTSLPLSPERVSDLITIDNLMLKMLPQHKVLPTDSFQEMCRKVLHMSKTDTKRYFRFGSAFWKLQKEFGGDCWGDITQRSTRNRLKIVWWALKAPEREKVPREAFRKAWLLEKQQLSPREIHRALDCFTWVAALREDGVRSAWPTTLTQALEKHDQILLRYRARFPPVQQLNPFHQERMIEIQLPTEDTFVFKDKSFPWKLLDTREKLEAESQLMGHCVVTYTQSVLRRSMLVMHFEVPSDPAGITVGYTEGPSRNPKEKGLQIFQAEGKNHHAPSADEYSVFRAFGEYLQARMKEYKDAAGT